MKPNLSHFDSLPDSALVSVQAFPVIAEIGVSTAWRRAKSEPEFPQPIRLSAKCTRFRVGDIRKFIGAAPRTEGGQ